jgi:polysaccharide biosynthesis protein PslH
MKILLISNKSPWPPKDGGSAATLSIIYGLRSLGASVTLAALNTSKHHVDINDIPADISDGYFLTDIDSGITPLKIISNIAFSQKAYSLTRFESAEFEKRLSSILKGKYDIIHIEGLAMTYYIPLIRRLTGASIIFRPHNIESVIWSGLASEQKNPFKKRYFNLLASRTRRAEISVIGSFDALVTMTLPDLEWFKARGLSVPSLVSPPGPLLKTRENSKEIPFSVFFIGALDWRPNISGLEWFIRNVWPEVLNSIPEASFHIAGRNPSHRVRKMCIGKGISFHGEVESSEYFMSCRSVMVVPLFSGSGIRVKIIEGMSLQKGIVATSTAASGLIFENRKNIIISDDASDFARQVCGLLENDEKRYEMGRNADENVRKNYNILATAENLLNFYSQLS